MQPGQRLNQGLYNADNEHDACGVGMIVNIHGTKNHELVDAALKVLENMKHRGAEGADNKTGDGAGITRGLAQAAASGVKVAQVISERLG